MFQTFWKITDLSQRKVFVSSHVTRSDTRKIQTDATDSRRQFSYFYSLTLKGGRVPVCRNMFLQTLGLGYKTVQSWVSKSQSSMTHCKYLKHRASPSTRKRPEKDFLNEFTDKFPKLPSHYQRSNSSKIFLETN